MRNVSYERNIFHLRITKINQVWDCFSVRLLNAYIFLNASVLPIDDLFLHLSNISETFMRRTT
jgi:hypothetical protein